MKNLALVILLAGAFHSVAQTHETFPFGEVPVSELQMTRYEKDTGAAVVVLHEQGVSSVMFSDVARALVLVHTYHVRMKILKKEGLDKANVGIPLYSGDGKSDVLRRLRASTYNLEEGRAVEVKHNPREVFVHTWDEHWTEKRFTLPKVVVGSVIEYQYEVEKAFFYNSFYPWDFQDSYPKIRSEYTAKVPANFRYNIALRGPLQLSKNESRVIKDCFEPGGGNRADCAEYVWAMTDVPAFVEEKFMTAKKNFLASIRFELLQLEYFDGRKDKITKEWKDADQELRNWDKFGVQLKRGKDVVDSHIDAFIASNTDPMAKARQIFDFIRGWYRWNENFGEHSEHGIRKAFERREGNVGDINLSLVAAMKYAGLEAEPVILSTRDNGVPTDLWPVLTEFNYVICKLDIAGKSYLLDATDDFLPFGTLPQRCLNGRGRVIGSKESYWYDLKPVDRAKSVTAINLRISEKGDLSGTLRTTYMGYGAAEKRREIYSFPSPAEYIKDRINKSSTIHIANIELQNVDDFSRPLVEVVSIEHTVFDESATHFLFNPFIHSDKWSENPFKSSERLFPVDFAVPIDEATIMEIELPANVAVEEIPPRVGLALPNGGGRLIFEASLEANKLKISNSMSIPRTVFSAEEYFYLKEFFTRVVAINTSGLLFRRKI